MAAIRNVAARRRGLRSSTVEVRDDAGTTLIELIVGMTILSIFMGMFTGAVVMLNQATNKAQAVNLTATQLNGAFLNLDRMVRYAAAISAPGTGTPSGDWYVEFRATNTGLVNPGTQLCTQLRVDAQQLQQRSWDPANLPLVAPSFAAVASGITNGAVASGSSDQPFVAVPLGASVAYQQLTLNLVSITSVGPSLTTSRSTFTFGALNSSVPPPPTSSICQQEGRP